VAHYELKSTMPTVELVGGYQLVLEAIDPATGSLVSGVQVSAVAIFASGGNQGRAGAAASIPLGPLTWLPIPVTSEALVDVGQG
jgi:hypothetical protein